MYMQTGDTYIHIHNKFIFHNHRDLVCTNSRSGVKALRERLLFPSHNYINMIDTNILMKFLVASVTYVSFSDIVVSKSEKNNTQLHNF